MGAVVDFLEELHARFVRDFSEAAGWETPPTASDFHRLLGDGSMATQSAKFNELGARVARGYHEGRYSFWFCDWVVNLAYGEVMERVGSDAFEYPLLFDQVYQAFDDGEWDHHDKPADPISNYTNPQIETIVRQLAGLFEVE
jgi:hypothetical protein